jgi:hypothetical protein
MREKVIAIGRSYRYYPTMSIGYIDFIRALFIRQKGDHHFYPGGVPKQRAGNPKT